MNKKVAFLTLLLLLILAFASCQSTEGNPNGDGAAPQQDQSNTPQGDTNPDDDESRNDNEPTPQENDEETADPVDQGKEDSGDNGNQDGDNDNNTDDQDQSGLKSVLIEIGDRIIINKQITSNDSYQSVGFFHFTIKDKLPNKDLTIMVRGREDFSHNPLLFYSKTNKYPDMSQSGDISCGLNGHDFCIVPQAEIIEKDNFYLGVFCLHSCKFEVVVLYDTLFKQFLNEQARYESMRNESYILELQIELPSDLSESIDHILIESYILNYETVESSFHMYVNKGTTPPSPSSYDYITEEFKLNGQSILIEKDEDSFVAGSVFSVAIEAPPQAHILVRSEGFGRERNIYFFKSLDDMVQKDKVRIFRLEISPFTSFIWDQEDISFDLEPYYGNSDLYVIHKELPPDPFDLASYTWKSTEEDGMESLTISRTTIGTTSLIGELFYIAVAGRTSSSFKLIAYSSNLGQRELNFNCIENGYVSHDDLTQYQFYPESNENSKITVLMNTLQGEAFLYLKRCLNLAETDFCYNLVDICSWAVGVLGYAQGDTEYRLLGKHSYTSTQLRENEEMRSFMMEGEKEYYKFTISQEDETITKVEFVLATISGEFYVYSSRKNENPNAQDNEQAEYASQDTLIYPKNQNNPTLKGTYYVGVEAISGCIYTIHVKVFRKQNDQVSSNMKRIHFGSVEKGYVSYLEPHQYYFTIPESEKSPTHETNIVLYFNAYKNHTVHDVRIDPNIAVHFLLEGAMQPVILVQNPYISFDFIYLKVYTNYTQDGKYIVSLNHKQAVEKDYKIKFQLNVNAYDVIYIVPRSAYILDLEVGKSDNYELYLNEPSKVYLEIFECFGKVKLQAANSVEKIESQIYDVPSSSPPRFVGDHAIVNYERTKSGPLYLAVTASSGTQIQQKQKSLYMIIPHILPQNQVIPHDVYAAPLEGAIITTVDFQVDPSFDELISQLSVNFGAIECANDCVGSIYQANSYKYIVHVTNNQNYMQYYAKCNMDTSSLKGLGFEVNDLYYEYQYIEANSTSKETNFTAFFTNLKNGTYYVEVMGIVYLETSYTLKISEPFTFIYPMKQFVVGTLDGDHPIYNTEEVQFLPDWIMIPIGIALFVLIIICIYKQIKTFLARRRYRLAIEQQRKEDIEVDGQINDDDEIEKKKKVDKINFLN